MTQSDDALPQPTDDEAFDPLTAPAWMFEDDDDILLAPPVAEFFSEFSGPGIVPTPPPNVDQIISREYTGWIPIIQAGESLAEAQARASEVSDLHEELNPEASLTVAETKAPSFTQQVHVVDDPDEVVSPAQALAQARERIASMRASLQLNLNKVASSFEHPIFTDATPEPVTQNIVEPPDVASLNTQESPQVTHVFVQTETQEPPVSDNQVASHEHSLELMIMRDEIKDLRDRLDASQKLIEDLMHRLANLAELALKRQS